MSVLPSELYTTEIRRYASRASVLVMKMVCKTWSRALRPVFPKPWDLLWNATNEGSTALVAWWMREWSTEHTFFLSALVCAGFRGHMDIIHILIENLAPADAWGILVSNARFTWPRPVLLCLLDHGLVAHAASMIERAHAPIRIGADEFNSHWQDPIGRLADLALLKIDDLMHVTACLNIAKGNGYLTHLRATLRLNRLPAPTHELIRSFV